MSSNKKILYTNLGIYAILCSVFGVVMFSPSDKAESALEEGAALTIPIKEEDSGEQKEVLPKGVLPISINTPSQIVKQSAMPLSKRIEESIVEDKETLPTKDTNYVSVKDVEAALAASKAKSPQIYEDALRVWKNFNGHTDPHYSYRF